MIESFPNLIDLVLHIDKYLSFIVTEYGVWTYLILFAIIFCETGLVVTPILPGDSLIFATGALAGAGFLDPFVLFLLLSTAAIAGDAANFWIGRRIGPAVFERKNSRFFNKAHLMKAHEFYERHGGKTIIIARFVPIIRTFAPFVAGVADMTYAKFAAYNVIGGIFWIGFFTTIGYFFGNMEIIRNNFGVTVYIIVFLSILPGVIEFLRARRARQSLAQPAAPLDT